MITSFNSEPFTFRVLTVNVHKGFTFFNRKFILPELRDAVRRVSADIVFLQEVIGTHKEYAILHKNWPPTPQYEFIADTMWPDFAYGRNAVYPHGHHGNALLSKFPIVRYDNLDISISGPEKRGLLHCVLYLPPINTEIHVICVHLGLREAHRQQQLALLCALIKTLPADAPLTVAGDFNDWGLRAHEILARGSGLQEIFVSRFGQAVKTFPAFHPLVCLDRIYVRNVRMHRPIDLPNRPWAHLSDHAPLAAEIQL